jgi:hypothetical protein
VQTPVLARRLGVLLAAATIACESTSGPDREAVAGAYVATTFTTVTNSVSTDQLAAGASLSITLNSDWSTVGQLVVPGANTDGSDFIASMAGSWTLGGTTVAFQQTADTFMREMDFEISGNTLVGDEIFGDTRVIVTLTKS